VTLLTCTRGELGEVIPPELKHLEGSAERLGEVRANELAAAMRVLGVSDHRFLGAENARAKGRPPRRYLDSGMQWGPDGAEPLGSIADESLSAAGFDEVVADIAAVIAEVEPDAVVSYNDHGGYGHPDHVRAGLESRQAAQSLDVPFVAIEPVGSASATVNIDVSALRGRKADALRAHRTQVTVQGDHYALSSGPSLPIGTAEAFRLVPTPWELMSWEHGRSWRGKLLAALAMTIGGVVVGTIATLGHQASVVLLGVPIWFGIAAALGLVAVLLIGLRVYFNSRLLPGCAATGVVLATGVLSFLSPGGSVVVPANPPGWVWTFGVAIIALVVLGWPRASAISGASLEEQSKLKGSTAP
jgi:N-acetyl-1-D-myo-inositol-2-amino-2-deoxy-alpha-D-glucopyranoside deacetylase